MWRSCLRFLRGWESRVVPFDVMRLLRWRREKLLYQAAFVGLEGLELLGFGGDQGVEVRHMAMSSRSWMNLASALMRPMSSSRVLFDLPGPLAE